MIITSTIISDDFFCPNIVDVIPPTINVFLDGSFTTTVVVPVREENWAPFSPSAAITDVYNGTNVTGVTNIAVKFRQYWG
jgi:hypothetical protein